MAPRDEGSPLSMDAQGLAPERLRALLDHSWDVLSLLDGEGRLIYNSPAAFELHGIDPQEMVGKSTLDYLHPDDRAAVGAAFQKCLDHPGQPTYVDYRYVKRGGGWLWMEAVGVNLLADPEVRGVVVNSRDISVLKAAQDAHRQSEANYQALLEGLPSGVVVHGADSTVLMANTAAQQILGLTKDRITGLLASDPVWSFLDSQGGTLALEGFPVNRVLATGQPMPLETFGLHRPGCTEPTWVECQAYPRRDEAGEVFQVVVTFNDITERRRMEAALRDSQQVFAEFMRHSPIHVYIKEVSPTESRVIQASENFRDMIGIGGSDMIGKTMAELFPPEFALKITADDWAVASQGRVLTLDEDLNGRNYTSYKFPIRRENHTLLAGYTVDITERKRIEEALRQESALLQDVIDHNPMSIQILDLEGFTLKVNPAHTRLFGAVPPPDYSLFRDPTLHAQGLGELLQRMQAGEVVVFPEFHYNAHELYPEFPDVPVWIRMVAFPIKGADGRPERFVLMHEDVTERARAEASLRNSEARNRALISAIPDLIFIQNPGGELVDYHATDPGKLLVPPEQFLGRRMDEVLPGPISDRWMKAARRALETDEVQVLEYALEVRGESLHFEARVAPCGGDLILSLVRDITESKRTEQLLRQGQKLESLGVLAGGIAHDFNNLLTAMLGNLNLAQLKLRPESPAHPHLDAVESIVLKASELTRQMLAYSGKGAFVIKRQNLNRMVEEMGHLLQVSISKKISLRFHLAPGLPAIEGDAAQIQQVIMNLVTNASDAIGDAEGSIRITTRPELLDGAYLTQTFTGQSLKPGPYATLEVNDTGCGIPPEILSRIFDPFFTTKATGRGLGLSAMHGILRGHGAGIKIYSEPGKGSTFKVFFPALDEEPATVQAAQDLEPEPGGLRGLALAVDDEPSILETLAGTLRAFGMEVLTARDGQEAVELVQSEFRRIDLVVMDLTMPRLDGREAFQQMRRLRPGLPVLLSSGYSEQESLQDFLGKGLAGFIQKPYHLRELRRAIQGVLHRGEPTSGVQEE